MNWTKLQLISGGSQGVTNAEWRTHGEALCGPTGGLLDLHIPKKDVRRFADTNRMFLFNVVTAGLAAKGWWRDDGDEWYIGVVHPEWQRSADEVRADQAKVAAQARRHRRHRNGDHSLCTPDTCEDAPSRRDAMRDVGRTDRRTSRMA